MRVGKLIMTLQDPHVVELSEEVYLWMEQDTSIHLKAVTKYGDPVELSAEEARELAQVLEGLAKKLDE